MSVFARAARRGAAQRVAEAAHPAGCGAAPVVTWSDGGLDQGDRVPSAMDPRVLGRDRAAGAVAVDAFAAWPLVPIRGGELVRVGHRAAVIVPPAPTFTRIAVADPLDSSVLSHETLDGTVDERDVDVDERDDVTFARPGSNQPRASPLRGVLFGSPSRAGLGSPARRTDVTAAKRPSRTVDVARARASDRGCARLDWDAAGGRARACWTVGGKRRARPYEPPPTSSPQAQQIRACLGAGRPSFALVDEETRGALFSLFATQHVVSGFAASGRVWR